MFALTNNAFLGLICVGAVAEISMPVNEEAGYMLAMSHIHVPSPQLQFLS